MKLILACEEKEEEKEKEKEKKVIKEVDFKNISCLK